MENSKIKEIYDLAVSKEASDIHLVSNREPIFRIHGDLIPSEYPKLEANELQEILFSCLNEDQIQKFLKFKEFDFSASFSSGNQSRVNIYYEKGLIAATIRIIKDSILSREQLGLPEVVDNLALARKGIIFISGTAGSGKSTTLNYMVNLINERRKCKVVTIEDPIEYVHKSKQSLIVQREVGNDTESFANALKFSLRQDPDVVVIGEIRDLESISMALTTAETGHLVITSVHAPNAVETVNRIIDVFPKNYREQICIQLAENLVGIVGQVLIPQKDSAERVLATEVLVASLPIRNIIRREALVELHGQMDADRDFGMHTYEKCLSRLARTNIITPETAREYAKNSHFLDL